MPEQTTENANMALVAPKPVAIAPRASLRETLEILKDAGLMDAMGRELVEREVAAALYDQDFRVARMFAASGYFSDVKGEDEDQSIAKAMTKLQLGRSWNMVPADAIQHIYLVNGRPAVQNEYLASKMRDAGLDWEIEWMRDANGDCIGCKLWPSRLSGVTTDGKTVYAAIMERVNGESVPASVTFTKAQADKIKVKEDSKWISLSEKSTYQAYAEDMYFWRCIARLRRRYATNVLSGVLTRSEAEELPSVEFQKALPAPEPKPMEIPPMQPSRSARARAGSKDIPGTVPPSGGDAPPYEPAATLPQDVAKEPPPAAAEPEKKTEPEKEKQDPRQADQSNESTYQQVVAIGKRRGESWFVRALYDFPPKGKVTPENLSQIKPDIMAEILDHVQRSDSGADAPRKGLF